MIGIKLGLKWGGGATLVQQALSILAKYGSAANLYLPGVGAINGITAGNWLDSAGATAATVDNPVGRVDNARGGANLVQATTANKPILRRGLVNLLTQSDFQNGVSDAPIRGGLVTESTLAGYGGALAFSHDGATSSYAYKAFSALANTQYTTSCVVVKMDDSGAPTFGSADVSSPLNTLALVGQSDGINPLSYTKAQLADGCWLVCVSYLNQVVTGGNFGVVKYATNNSRTFRVTRYGLFVGQYTAQQIIAAGGIPLTTTAPASSANGPFAWQFDGSNDSFASTLTTGNAGWICGGTNVQTLGSAGALFIGNGAFSATGSPGIMIYSHGADGGRFMQLWLSNGASRQSVGSTVTPTGSAFVFDGGWDSSNAAIAINGVEQNLIKTIDVTSAQTIRIGIDPGLFWMLNGFVFAAIIMPTVLPTASERATLRRFIASLSGVTL